MFVPLDHGGRLPCGLPRAHAIPLIALFPPVWIVITVVKREPGLYSMRSPLWFHLPPTLKHFRLLFTPTWLCTWMVNTAVVALAVVVIALAPRSARALAA